MQGIGVVLEQCSNSSTLLEHALEDRETFEKFELLHAIASVGGRKLEDPTLAPLKLLSQLAVLKHLVGLVYAGRDDMIAVIIYK